MICSADFLLVGEGGTGKSMFLSQVQRLIGRDNICARAWADYGNTDFAFGDLFGKALALDSDIDVARPLSGAIKPAVTGNILTCNKKYQQPFDFNPFATWIGSINKFPKTRDKTWGFFRRWIVIPFNKTFKTDSQFERQKRKLWTDDETVSRIISDAIFLYILAYQDRVLLPFRMQQRKCSAKCISQQTLLFLGLIMKRAARRILWMQT